jgi:peptidoglycan/LPS O-acetylase OafA/YrhL
MATHPPAPLARVHLRSLTGLRFYAALVVVLYHFSRLFQPMEATSPVVGFGYTGVSFFFILSGFVLAWSHRSRGTKVAFYWRRFARVWPLHALTTALAVPVALLTGSAIMWPALPFVLTLTQAWIPPGEWRYAFNGPSWSLACEAFFYLLFPLLISRLTKLRRLLPVGGAIFLGMVVIGAAGVAVAPERAHGYLFYTMPPFRLGEFIIGICLALAIQRGWRPRFNLSQAMVGTAGLYAVLMIGTLSVLGDVEDLPYVVANLWLLPGFVAIIAAATNGDIRGHGGHMRTRSIVRLGQWSFALYLLHGLVIKLAIPAFDGLTFWPAFGASMVVLVVSIGLSGFLYECFERPIERRLRSLITAPTPATT